jgi:hypothetical protein
MRASLFLNRRKRVIWIAKTMMATISAPTNLFKLIPCACCALPAEPSIAVDVGDAAVEELEASGLEVRPALEVMLERDADKEDDSADDSDLVAVGAAVGAGVAMAASQYRYDSVAAGCRRRSKSGYGEMPMGRAGLHR